MNDNERIYLAKRVFEERLQGFKNDLLDVLRNGVQEAYDVEVHFNKRMKGLDKQIAECQDVIEWLGVLAARPDSPQSS